MQPLRGIIPPLVTPFDDNEEINEAAVQAEVRYMIEQAGVHGVVRWRMQVCCEINFLRIVARRQQGLCGFAQVPLVNVRLPQALWLSI